MCWVGAAVAAAFQPWHRLLLYVRLQRDPTSTNRLSGFVWPEQSRVKTYSRVRSRGGRRRAPSTSPSASAASAARQGRKMWLKKGSVVEFSSRNWAEESDFVQSREGMNVFRIWRSGSFTTSKQVSPSVEGSFSFTRSDSVEIQMVQISLWLDGSVRFLSTYHEAVTCLAALYWTPDICLSNRIREWASGHTHTHTHTIQRTLAPSSDQHCKPLFFPFLKSFVVKRGCVTFRSYLGQSHVVAKYLPLLNSLKYFLSTFVLPIADIHVLFLFLYSLQITFFC